MTNLNSDETPPPTALVAEDDEQISYLLKFLLEREGFCVLLARDGLEAKNLVDRIEPPNLIILDIMMPYADGFEVLSCIRTKPGWTKLPVIMLTAKSQENDIVRALKTGATDYIIKPFLPEELKARIRKLVMIGQ
jgi:DNA-binding response OmpR family regulator